MLPKGPTSGINKSSSRTGMAKLRMWGATLIWMGSALFVIHNLNGNTVVNLAAAVICICAGLYTLFVKCPHCGFPVGKAKKRIGKTEISYWSIGRFEKCRSCGQHL